MRRKSCQAGGSFAIPADELLPAFHIRQHQLQAINDPCSSTLAMAIASLPAEHTTDRSFKLWLSHPSIARRLNDALARRADDPMNEGS